MNGMVSGQNTDSLETRLELLSQELTQLRQETAVIIEALTADNEDMKQNIQVKTQHRLNELTTILHTYY